MARNLLYRDKVSVPQPAATRAFRPRRNTVEFALFLAVLAAAFALPLIELLSRALHNDLISHIVLIPIVSGYLIYVQRKQLPRKTASAPGWAALFATVGAVSVYFASKLQASHPPISPNDHLALLTFGFVCFVVAGGFIFMGREWMRAAAFPFAFLIFFVPMPQALVDFLEEASKLASAEVANALFIISGTPFLRDGTFFALPGITLEVAKECSGIRSSLVLFITSVLASYIFLKSPWRRIVLVAVVIPLGILRNGFRILVIGLLCVHYGPQMIESVIHRHGGPLFFILSLIPLFLVLRWLRRSDPQWHLKPGSVGAD